jgi:hypothetical protein
MKRLEDRQEEGAPIESSLPPGKNCPVPPWVHSDLAAEGVNPIGHSPGNLISQNIPSSSTRHPTGQIN